MFFLIERRVSSLNKCVIAFFVGGDGLGSSQNSLMKYGCFGTCIKFNKL